MPINTSNETNIDYFDQNIEDCEECMICRDELGSEPCYTLPECSHKFHTNCIISWFRNGDSRCPYCSNKGINNCNHKNNIRYSYRYRYSRNNIYFNQYISDIKKYVNQHKLKDDKRFKTFYTRLDKLKELQNDLTNSKKELSEFKKNLKDDNFPVNYYKARNELSKKRSNIYKIKGQIMDMQIKIMNNSYIVPLIIPIQIDLSV